MDQSSLTFGPTGVEAGVHRCDGAGEDANGDGLLDLVCTFPARDTGFQSGDTVGILKGQTLAGIPIEGSDSVRILVR